MISELREHLAFLAEKLGEQVRYEYAINTDAPSNIWPQAVEYHRIKADKHKGLTRLNFKQVLELKPEDFMKTEDA